MVLLHHCSSKTAVTFEMFWRQVSSKFYHQSACIWITLLHKIFTFHWSNITKSKPHWPNNINFLIQSQTYSTNYVTENAMACLYKIWIEAPSPRTFNYGIQHSQAKKSNSQKWLCLFWEKIVINCLLKNVIENERCFISLDCLFEVRKKI